MQAEYDRFKRESPTQLSVAEREQIQSLAEDLPVLWHAPSTTPEDRQAIAWLLLEKVTVTVEGNTERVEVELRWIGGFVSRHTLTRPVQTYEQLSNYNELVARIEALRAEHKTLSEIAATLNSEGFHPPKQSAKFTKGILCNLLRERRAKSGNRTDLELNRRLRANEWWLADLASELSMPIATLHRWRRVGWVASRKVQIGRGRWAIYADTAELERMRRLRVMTRSWPPIYPTELITPKSRPAETGRTKQAEC